MARRSPAEFYIKYLLIHPDRYGADQIRSIVRSQGLDYLGSTYLNTLRTIVEPVPTPFYPHDSYHRRSQQYLVKQGVRAMFLPDQDMRKALRFIEFPRAKEIIETSLISGDVPSWVAALLCKKGIDATKRSVELYRHFFWNLDLLDESELRAILYARTYPEVSQDPDEQKMSQARLEARFDDSRRKAIEMASPMSAVINRMRHGLMPSKVELVKLAQAARMVAVSRTFDTATRGGPKDGERSRDYALVAQTMNNLISDLGDPEADLKDDIANLKLITDEQPVPHIRQLTGGGGYTTDLAPDQSVSDAAFEEADDE